MVKVYRVEGDANQRFIIDSQGDVSLVPNKDTMLFLNIGDSQRAMDFLNQRASQSAFFNPTLKSFDADSSLLLKLRLRSVPQRFGRLYPDYAQILLVGLNILFGSLDFSDINTTSLLDAVVSTIDNASTNASTTTSSNETTRGQGTSSTSTGSTQRIEIDDRAEHKDRDDWYTKSKP